MNFQKQWLLEACNELGVELVQLTAENEATLRSETEKLYAKQSWRERLWPKLCDSHSICDPDVWEEIANYESDEQPMLFYDAGPRKGAYRFESFQQMIDVMRETPGFEFFVITKSLKFVIAYNFHQYLIGAGEAKAWVVGLEKK